FPDFLTKAETMRILIPTAAACAAAAMVTTLGLSSSTAAIAVPVNPDISSTPLTDIDADGLDESGARASSESTATASNRSLVNVPGLLRAPQGAAAANASTIPLAPGAGAFAATTTSLTDSSEDAEDAPGLGDSSADEPATDEPAESAGPAESEETEPPVVGSVQEETEDGVEIAAISKAVDVPAGNPSVVGVTYEGDASVSFEVRTQTDGTWGAWTDLEIENTDEGGNGTEPFIVADAQSVQLRVLGASTAPEKAELVLVDPKSSAADAEAVEANAPVLPAQDGVESDSAEATESGDEAPADASGDTAEAANAASATEATVQNASFTPGSATVQN